MIIIRTDKTTGKEEIIRLETVMMLLEDHYGDKEAVKKALLNGQTIQTTFATWHKRTV